MSTTTCWSGFWEFFDSVAAFSSASGASSLCSRKISLIVFLLITFGFGLLAMSLPLLCGHPALAPDHEPVAAQLLGFVHRAVGELEKRLGRLGVLGRARDAH